MYHEKVGNKKNRTWEIIPIENIPLEIICIQNINPHIKSFHFLINMICLHRFIFNQYNKIESIENFGNVS